jgi:hypothetical protein
MTEVPAPAPAPGPAPAAEPKPSPFARMIGVLFSPDETFASIARKPDWVVPLIVLMVISLVSGLILSPRVDWAAPAREAMEQNPNASPEQVEQAERIATGMGKVLAFAAPALYIIMLLIVAGICLLAFRLMGGEGTFKQAWAASIYSQMPNVIKSIVTVIILLARGGDAGQLSPLQLPTLLRSNLAFLFDPKTNPVAFALAANFDIFSIWVLVLLIFGFAHLARVSKTKSAAILVTLFIVKCLFGLIGPAMQSLRTK